MFWFIRHSLSVLFQFNGNYKQFLEFSGMLNLKSENAKLAMLIQEYIEAIDKQKQINSQHQIQIEILLLFNHRLLNIIETEISDKRKDSCSLQPISERSERSSDLFGQCAMESFVKNKKPTVKSEWGGQASKSMTDWKLIQQSKVHLFDRSSDFESFKNEKASETAANQEDIQLFSKSRCSEVMDFRHEIQKGIQQLRQFKDKTNIFYDKKISQIKYLSNRLNNYHPLDEVLKITSKMTVSNKTIILINTRIAKLI